jgi:hypothetical protein
MNATVPVTSEGTMDEPGTGAAATAEGLPAAAEGVAAEGGAAAAVAVAVAAGGVVATDELHPPTTALTSNPIPTRVSAPRRGRMLLLFMSTSI